MRDDTVSSISDSRTIEEIADVWESYSLADYGEETHEVEMSFDASARRAFVKIEPELMQDISQLVRQRKASVQTRINVWLRRRVDRPATQTAG